MERRKSELGEGARGRGGQMFTALRYTLANRRLGPETNVAFEIC